MPITHLACPSDKAKFGEVHTIDECILDCREQCMSPALMAAVWSSNVRNHHKGRYISATALSGCKRKLQLERTIPYSEEFRNLYYSFRGTITHNVVEEAAEFKLPGGKSLSDLGFLTEWSMRVGFCCTHGAFQVDETLDLTKSESHKNVVCPKCDPSWPGEVFILGGTLDTCEPIRREEPVGDGPLAPFLFDKETGVLYARLHDLKTQAEPAISYFIRGSSNNKYHPQVKDDYVAQARVYAYLAKHSKVPKPLSDWGVKRIVIKESHIQAFAMSSAPWTGGGTCRWREDSRSPYKDWPMYPIDLGDDAWVEDYIRTNGKEILDTLILEKRRATICSPAYSSNGSHSWACDFCAFHTSEYCPNPRLEYKSLQEGLSAEEAFDKASRNPRSLPVIKTAKLTDHDQRYVREYFRKNTPANNQ